MLMNLHQNFTDECGNVQVVASVDAMDSVFQHQRMRPPFEKLLLLSPATNKYFHETILARQLGKVTNFLKHSFYWWYALNVVTPVANTKFSRYFWASNLK